MLPSANHDLPLLEFDPNPTALIDPTQHTVSVPFPDRAVVSWFGDVVRERTKELTPVYVVRFEHGDNFVYVVQHRGVDIALTTLAVGAPAAVTTFEVLIALGATKVIGCGGAGIVRPGFDVGHVIVPTGAIRDEGTSYHYAPADAELAPHPDALAAIDSVLTEAGVPHDRGLTWTTDAFFRETATKVARRREQGCLTVEMEASAMFAVAQFRSATYGQLLYAGDDVSAQEWDHREWDRQTSARERLLDLALAAAARL